MRGALIRPGMLATAARNLECHRNTCWWLRKAGTGTLSEPGNQREAQPERYVAYIVTHILIHIVRAQRAFKRTLEGTMQVVRNRREPARGSCFHLHSVLPTQNAMWNARRVGDTVRALQLKRCGQKSAPKMIFYLNCFRPHTNQRSPL